MTTTKMTFTSEVLDEDGNVLSSHTNTSREAVLSAILQEFELFLRGAGFYFDGKVTIDVDDIYNKDGAL